MPSGRPDWFGTIVAAGKYDDTYLPIALDADGFITATIKGAYDAVLETIAVDVNGVMKANISVQDLAELIMRPKYGAAQRLSFADDATANSTISLGSVSGKGVLYQMRLEITAMASVYGDNIYLFVDGEELQANDIAYLRGQNMTDPHRWLMFLNAYDEVNYKYDVGSALRITFETSFEIKYKETNGKTPYLSLSLIHALV